MNDMKHSHSVPGICRGLPSVLNHAVTHRFQITNTTTPETLDTFFTELWRTEPKVHLLMDTTGCDISLGKALSIKHVLDKHRKNSKNT